MKFDVVVGNPPYQKSASDGGKKTEPIWYLFGEKMLALTEDGGYFSMIHPSGWRNVEGKFKKFQQKLMKNTFEYLEMHGTNDGITMFGVTTTYDWYVIKKDPNTTNKKTVINNGDYTVNLTDMEFIPNGYFDEIATLVAKPGEDKVEVLHSRGAYGSDNGNMMPENSDDYPHPCAMNIGQSNNITKFRYSNTNKNGHFGVPKLMFGRFGSGVAIDETGEYGMGQDVSAIVDDVENLVNIKKAMQSEKFIELSNACSVGGLSSEVFNRKVIATFRKDFWKEFI